MFGTIRKHQTWLWAVIITLTIISFVIFFSPYSKMNESRRAGDYGTINGEKVSEQQFINARREVDLHYFFMTGRWPEEDRQANFDPLRETYQWLLVIQKQEQLGIHVGQDTAAQLATQMIRPFERSGINSPATFIQKVLQPRGYRISDFERFVRHYAGIQELISTAGLSGKLITPQEVETLYKRENQEIASSAVFFHASNYLANVTVTPEALSQFYSNRLASYRIPDRVQVSYVKFNISNYTAQAEADLKTNLNDIVESNYQRYGTNLFPDAKTPEEAKTRLRAQVIQNQATTLARKKALDFANVLFDQKVLNPGDLARFAQSNNLPVAVTAPFTREAGPKELEVGPDFAKASFGLTPEDPFGGPIVGVEDVYVLAFNKKVPSAIPSLDSIRAQVTEEYKFNEALTLARQAAQGFYQTATNGLAQGKKFDAVALLANDQPVQVPPFSLSTRTAPPAIENFVNLNQLKQAAFGGKPGEVSPAVPTRDGAMVLFVKEMLPLDKTKMAADLPDFTQMLRQRRQQEDFNRWLSREADRGLRNTPAFQQQQQVPPNIKSGGKA